jgi:outer membrane protein assembly factor BamB
VPDKDVSKHIWKVYCLDKKSGKILWERVAYEGIPKVKRHTKATQANSTPATDGKRLVVLFGAEGLFTISKTANKFGSLRAMKFPRGARRRFTKASRAWS